MFFFFLYLIYLFIIIIGGVTWTGCGLHVPIAMGDAPKAEWCTCLNADGSKGEYPPKVGTGISSS